jgi:hypothetical protein
MEKKPKGIKRVDDTVTVDPNNDYYNADSNFNTGDAPSVVMIGGKAVQVRNGSIIKPAGEKKTDEEKKYESGDMGKLDMGDAQARIVQEND